MAENDLLQLQLSRFPVGLSVLSVNDVGNASVSRPVVGAEDRFPDPLNVDVEEVGFGLEVFVAEVGHADGESLFFRVVAPNDGLYAQRGGLIVVGLIKGDDFATDVAHGVVQRSYVWLKIPNIGGPFLVGLDYDSVPVGEFHSIAVLNGIESAEINKISVFDSMKVFLKHISFLLKGLVLYPDLLFGR